MSLSVVSQADICIMYALIAEIYSGLVASSVTLYYRGTSLAGKGTSANEVVQMLGQ